MKFLNILIILAFIVSNLNATQWTQTSGPKKSGNYITANTIQKITDNTFVVGTDGGGIYKTTNSGISWTNVLNISSMVWTIYKNPNGDLFAGSDLNGVYRSTNNGDSWTQIFNPGSLVFDFNTDASSNLYACNEIDGVYKSTDNGNTWELFWQTDLVPVSIVIIGGDFYVGTIADGLYYSDDGGQTFNNLAFPGDIVWDLVESQGSIFACNEMSGINKSTDGTNFTSYAFSNSSVSKYFVTSTNVEYLIVDVTDIYRYNTSESQWQSFKDGLDLNGVSDLDEDADGYLLTTAFGAGVYKTTSSIFSPEILTLGTVSTEYCAGNFFTIDYTVKGGFETNNNFHIQLSDASGDFSNPINIGSTQSQVSGSMDVVIPFDSPYGTNYKIRIISTHPELIGPYSAEFKVNELNTNLVSPAFQASDVAQKPTFSWDANDCTLSYSLEISKSSDFSQVDYRFDGLSNISYTMTENLEKGTTYYWRLILYSTLGDEMYTQAFSFTTLSTVTQQIVLNLGWNMISSYISIDNMNIANYLNSIKSQILIVKNPEGKVYIPDYNINDIGDWNNAHGYQVYMKSAQTLELTGEAILPENTVLTLKAGWNRIAYLRNSNLTAPTAFAQLNDDNNLLIAKNLAGQAYIPSFGINNLGDLIPGVAYIIYVNRADSFYYPAN